MRPATLKCLPITVVVLSLSTMLAGSLPAAQKAIFLTGRVFWPGASHRRWTNADRSDDLVNLQGTVPSATIGPAAVRMPYRVLYVSRDAIVGRIEIQGIDALVADGCVRAHAASILVRDTHCRMAGFPQTGGVNMPFGLNVTSAQELVVQDSSFDGFQWRAPQDRYWNGDGIAVEMGVTAARFDRVSANNNTDAGFDVRPFAIMTDVSAAGNCRNFRFWSGGEIGTLATGDSVKRGGISVCSGIWLNGSAEGSRPKLHIANLIVRMRRPGLVFEVETGPADIEVDRCEIEAPEGTTMIRFEKGAGHVHMGHGCKLPTSNH